MLFDDAQGRPPDRLRAVRLPRCALRQQSLRELVAGEVAPPSALAVIGDMRAMVPMEGLIDPQAEVARLEKRAAKTRDEIQKARNKLANENFVRNAPPEVVTQEQGRVADFERTLASIDSQLQRVRALLK